jgi:hypothetical protein
MSESPDKFIDGVIAGEIKRLIPIFEEIESSNDRAAAIAASAFFEEALVRAIKSRFVDLSREKYKDIFEGYGPLSTLSAKIDIGYALGLYKEISRADLQCSKKIRNLFAHHVDKRSFGDDPIAKLCHSLKRPTMERKTGGHFDLSSPRDRYVLTLKEIGYALLVNLSAAEQDIFELS